jgi:ATP-binding cassette subfamily B protein
MANVAQKTVCGCAGGRGKVRPAAVEVLRFADAREVSRAVNDLDSISGTLQQNLTQLLTSVLTLIGVIVMMLTISWILTLVTVLTLPISIVVVARIAKRSKFFMKQQMALGALNGHSPGCMADTIVTAATRKVGRDVRGAQRHLLRQRMAHNSCGIIYRP